MVVLFLPILSLRPCALGEDLRHQRDSCGTSICEVIHMQRSFVLVLPEYFSESSRAFCAVGATLATAS